MMRDTGYESQSVQNRIQSFASTAPRNKLQEPGPFVVAVVAAFLLSVGFAASSFVRFRQPQPIELSSRINPNHAPAASLVRLPGIGVSKAEAIVAHRDSLAAQKAGLFAFEDCNDLQKVKGIGPKTVKNISQWLKFE